MSLERAPPWNDNILSRKMYSHFIICWRSKKNSVWSLEGIDLIVIFVNSLILELIATQVSFPKFVGRCSFDYLHSAFFVRHIFTYCCQTLLRFHVKYFISKSWRESSHNFKVGKTFNIFAKMRESCLCIIFAVQRLRKCLDCWKHFLLRNKRLMYACRK